MEVVETRMLTVLSNFEKSDSSGTKSRLVVSLKPFFCGDGFMAGVEFAVVL